MLEMRVVHLPIPFDILQLRKDEIYKHLAENINNNLNEGQIGTIFPKKSFTQSLDPSWYGHTLFVGNKDLFLREAKTSVEKERLETNIFPLKEI